MILFKTLTAICLGAMLCTAQTINISGFVKDSGGVGIVGATVKLEKANVSATSGAGGAFTLTGSSTSSKPSTILSAMSVNPVKFQNGKIAFTLAVNTSIGIFIHDVGGRLLFSSRRMLGSGVHSIGVPLQTAGVYLCKITIGHESYGFKASPFGASSVQQGVGTRGTSALAMQAKTTAAISDIIAATSPGKLNYRCVVENSDTSGVIINMLENAGDVADADGNVYQSVQIGNQVWMTENLRSTKYNDGSALPNIISDATWDSCNYTEIGAYCYYDNTTDSESIKKFGALYNWYAVSPLNVKRIAPAGWHVPSGTEWDTLQNYLIAQGYTWDEEFENTQAKVLSAKTDWKTYSVNGTIGSDLSKNNSIGFSALPGGLRGYFGAFYYQSSNGYWWSVTEVSASYAHVRNLNFASTYLDELDYIKDFGFSVRLVRD